MSRTRHHHRRRMRWGGPNWWHHLFSEVPARAKARVLERISAGSPDLDDVDRVEWPLARRPHRYYW